MSLLATLLFFAAGGPRPWLGFPAYPGARALCAERVYGTGMEIHWQSHATPDPVAKVVAFYEKDQGAKPKRDGKRLVWRDRANDDLVLSVYPAADGDAFPSCAKKPTPEERTVIQVSIAFRRK